MGKSKKGKSNKGGNVSGSDDGNGGQAVQRGGTTSRQPPSKKLVRGEGGGSGSKLPPAGDVVDANLGGHDSKIKEDTIAAGLPEEASTSYPVAVSHEVEKEHVADADGRVFVDENGNNAVADVLEALEGREPDRDGAFKLALQNAYIGMRRELFQEKETVLTLRKQLSSLEEQAALRDVNEAATLAEIKRLREENGQIAGEVSSLRESMEKLEAEKKQLGAKLAAVQMGMQQLEREASIRARVQQDLAEATTDQPKSWWGGGKDPVAEAAALAEEARVQKVAAASTVNKLLEENADLMERLNEQSALIDRLAQRYSALAERVDDHGGATSSALTPTAGGSPVVVSRAATPRLGTPTGSYGHGSNNSNGGEERLTESALTGSAAFVIVDGNRSNRSLGGSPSGAVINGKGAAIKPLQGSPLGGQSEGAEEGDVTLTAPALANPHWRSEIEELPVENGTGSSANNHASGKAGPPVHMRGNGTGHAGKDANGIPFSDSPIMGAPIRVVSFLTRFVTGEDLIKK